MTDQPNRPTSPSSVPESGPSEGRGALPLAINMLQKLDAKAKPDLKRAVPAVLIALISFVVGDRLGGVGRSTPAEFHLFGGKVEVSAGWSSGLVVILTIIFIVAGIIGSRSVAKELGRVSEERAGVAARSAVRLICVIIGYLTIIFGVLTLLRVDLGNLLVGGAVTGVVIGIAAQQTLGNFFAGLVLFFARPYLPGQRVKIRSGAMGGPFVGTIIGAGVMYTVIETAEGPISMPNSGLLGAAIGPASPPEPAADQPA